ncbi:low affinity iron permease family protein [Chelatococcus sp. GCM10030263]|uniref:low affinity iron permease family protein n=1 Tax=Chelatococcus sp. GCM10030263 TaxID=3273387 RepID=UPI00361832A4
MAKDKSDWFGQFASQTARLAGSPAAFGIACAIVVGWAISGPFLGFSDVWQLTINTGTTIITFLMVFIIQNTQNRDAEAMHIKLDELIRATIDAQNSMLDLEDLSQKELDTHRKRYEALAREARLGATETTTEGADSELHSAANALKKRAAKTSAKVAAKAGARARDPNAS